MPSWANRDSLQASHSHFVVENSPPDTPKIKAHGLRGPTIVGSPLRGPGLQMPRKYSDTGTGHQHKAYVESSLDDIMSFVKEKVCKYSGWAPCTCGQFNRFKT